MKPNFYLDLKIKNLDLNIPSAEGVPPAIVLVISKLVSAFHAYNSSKNENNIAIAFPEYASKDYRKLGFIVRFFAEEREIFDDLSEYFEENTFIAKHFDVRGVKKVNFNNVSKYSAYLGRKLPRKLTIKNDKYSGLNIENYITRCEYLHSLPNIRVKSSSNGNSFSLFIERKKTSLIEKNDGVYKNDEGALSSYGFSCKSGLVYLPEIP